MTSPQRRPQPYHLDPDPLYVEPVDVRVAARPHGLAWLVFASTLVILATLAVSLLLLAAPPPAPDPTVADPSASGQDAATGDASSASALGDASGPALSGAPLEREAGNGPADRQDSGALGNVAMAGPQWAGTATWYCSAASACTRGTDPSDMVAAIDSDLGIPKGAFVRVRSQAGPGSVVVQVVDVCACAGRRLIDLTSGAFRRLAPLSAGVIPVTLEVVGLRTTLPPTSTEG